MKENKELNPFQQIIKDFLDKKAKEDKLFAKTYAKPNKNICECCQYIIEEARKQSFESGQGSVTALPDEDVYNMAVHYYDEDDIVVNGKTNADVKTNKPTKSTKSTKKKEDTNKGIYNGKGEIAVELTLF